MAAGWVDEPRAPKGGPHGGEWTRVGGWAHQLERRLLGRGRRLSEDDLRRLALEEKPLERRRLSGGATALNVEHRRYSGGDVISKVTGIAEGPDSIPYGANAEVAAYKVARAIGLDAPTVIHSPIPQNARGWQTVHMERVPGETALEIGAREAGEGAGKKKIQRHRQEVGARYANTDQGRLMGLLDILIGNTDRNLGNWIITPGGDLVPIDHASSFRAGVYARDPVTGRPSPERQYADAMFANPFASHFWGERVTAEPGKPVLSVHAREWADNDMHPADLDLLEERLQKLHDSGQLLNDDRFQPEFHSMPLFDEMMQRLRHIRDHAKGTKRRIF